MTLGPYHTVEYPVGPGALPEDMQLPALTVGETRTLRLDLTRLLGSADRTIDPAGLVAVIAPAAALTGSVSTPAPGARDLLVTLRALAPCDAAVLELSIGLVPDGRVIWTLGQAVQPLDPALPPNPLTLGNQPLTAAGQPLAIEALQPLLAGAVAGDLVITYRPARTLLGGSTVPAVLGTTPAGGGSLAQTAQEVTFVQAMPAATWSITHNLNRHPAVRIADTSGNLVEGDVHYDSANAVTLSFAAAFAGTAYLN